MATILSQYSTTGFYNAPASKGLMAYMFLTCTTLNVPLLAHLKRYLVCKLPEALFNGEIWRIASTKLAFVDTKDLVCGSLLIYYFRVFERRYGSHKFTSYLMASQIVSVALEVMTIMLLQWFGLDFHNGGFLPPGPYGLIFPLFVSYYSDIPRVTQTSVFGIPITGKTLTYILGLQVCSTSPATAISAICGILSGLMYRHDILYMQQIPWIPRWLSKAAKMTLGRLLASSSPPDGPLGATLELQRQEQMELLEQQMMMNRAREIRNRTEANGAIPHLGGVGGRREDNAAPAVQPPSETQVQTLVEMGFDRQRVITALMTSNNDVNMATHLLLQET